MTADPPPPRLGAPLPPDEQLRLVALYALALLDTPPEERFDRITRTAQRALRVPMALVTLVDIERQWFKSCQGVGMRETERSASFCAYAIHADDAFVVTDTRADPRFVANPLVTGSPFIRAYLGIPLHGGGGHRVGTLCVLDDHPRLFPRDEVDALWDLARWAESELNQTDLAEAVAAQRATEGRLEAMRRRLELILEATAEGICGLDPEGLLVLANPAARRMFGLGADDDITGIDPHARFHNRRPDGTPYPWEDCPSFRTLRFAERVEVGNEVFFRADGTEFPVEYASAPIVERGAVSGAVMSFTDITERRAVERMKDEFVSVVSHELRTPLTSIRGSLGLLAGGELGALSAQAQRMADIAVSNTDRLVRLVNDILDLERIESGEIELKRSFVTVARLLDDAVAAVAGSAERRGVELRRSEVGGLVWVDADRMVQAVANLLSNAVKFSEPGQDVDLDASVDGDALQVVVVDRGRGIPPSMQERIFDRFQQVDTSDARERAGTGLGLAIVRSIVDQHGGTVAVQSAPGRGSTFTITIPRDTAEPREDSGAPPEQDLVARHGGRRPERRVLMIDDDPDIRDVAVLALEQLGGYKVVTAGSGQEGLQAAQEQAPDVILLDVMMPGMDGPSTLVRLREHPVTAGIPVVFLTAKAQAADRERFARMHVAGVLSKPFDPMTLAVELDRVMGWGG